MRDGKLNTLGCFLFFLAANLADLRPESLDYLNAPNTEKKM